MQDAVVAKAIAQTWPACAPCQADKAFVRKAGVGFGTGSRRENEV